MDALRYFSNPRIGTNPRPSVLQKQATVDCLALEVTRRFTRPVILNRGAMARQTRTSYLRSQIPETIVLVSRGSQD